MGSTPRADLEILATEVLTLRPRVAELEEANRRLEAQLARSETAAPPAAGSAATPPPSVTQMSQQELQTLANEVFTLRRRVVELQVTSRDLRKKVASAGLLPKPPVPKVPESGFAFGISDANGLREVVVPRTYAKLGSESINQVVLEGARLTLTRSWSSCSPNARRGRSAPRSPG